MSLVQADLTSDREMELYSYSDTDDASDDLFIEDNDTDEVMLFDSGIEELNVGLRRDQCETLHGLDEGLDADLQEESIGSDTDPDAEIDERYELH